MTADLCPGCKICIVTACVLTHIQLFVAAGCNEDGSGRDTVSGFRLANSHRTKPVNALCVHFCENRRHMLHNYNSGSVGREILYDFDYSLCTSG
jgi:hypothetical protein